MTYISLDNNEILPNLEESVLDFDEISSDLVQNVWKVAEIDVFWVGQVSWVLKEETLNRPIGVRTHVRPLEQSDRVVVGWVGRVGWTPLYVSTFAFARLWGKQHPRKGGKKKRKKKKEEIIDSVMGQFDGVAV